MRKYTNNLLPPKSDWFLKKKYIILFMLIATTCNACYFQAQNKMR